MRTVAAEQKRARPDTTATTLTTWRVGAPADTHEREADLFARQVLDASAPRLQRQPKMVDGAEGGTTAAPAIVDEVLRTPGQPLDPAARIPMEQRFGHDFSRVRVHADGHAARSADAVNALAYTAGHDVVFGAGRYAPGTAEGDRLLAHELTHTLQQGAATNTIQRSLKFEFQTSNYVWVARSSGAPDPLLLPRKYAPTSVGYAEGAGEERGDQPAYLSVGHRGGAARPKGSVAFVEVEGAPAMKPAKGIDPKLPAQFVETYQFTKQVNVKDLIGKPVAAGQLKLTHETNYADIAKAKYNPNTFELQYFNADGTRLDVHVDEHRVFEKGRIDHMKVGREERTDVDRSLPAQTIETWKITVDPKAGTVDYLGKPARVELVHAVDNAKIPSMKGAYNPNTWTKDYYLDSDFTGTTLNKGAKRLKVHRDDDGSFAPGRVELMEKAKPLKAAKEQTAIELQSEHGGVLEFETPKWFRDWPELNARIQDAVDMTTAISGSTNVKDKPTLEAIDKRKKSTALGRVVEWPRAYSTAHLKHLTADKRRLLVQIIDEKWFAAIQSSESIPLSEYESLLKQHESAAMATNVITVASKIFSTAFKAARLKTPALDESRFADLKGFLELIVTYIYRGQIVNLTGLYAKAAFFLMARTNFASMYKTLLSREEQSLFQSIVRDPKDPILTELQSWISKSRKTTLTRTTPFFFTKVGTDPKKTTHGPAIYDWLDGIIRGKDLLTGGPFSAAMGAKVVSTTPGEKDYKRARFEVRGTNPPSDRVQPAAKWVSYAKKIFDAAKHRASDTPDDPSTPGINEASKSALKD